MLLVIFCGEYVSVLVENVSFNTSLSTIISISGMFLVANLLNSALTYIFHRVTLKSVRISMNLMFDSFLRSYSMKKLDFNLKVNNNYIYSIDKFVYIIANYINVDLVTLCCSVASLIPLVILMILENNILTFAILLHILINLGITYFQYSKKSKLFSKALLLDVNSNVLYNKINTYSSINKNSFLLNHYTRTANSFFSNFMKIFDKRYNFDSNITFIQSISESFLNILFAILIFFSISQNYVSLSTGILLFTYFSLYCNSIHDILSIIGKNYEFSKAREIYFDYTLVSNNEMENINFVSVKEIDDIRNGSSYSKKMDTLLSCA
jgi:hypothetical protein